jgi:hypothetical protein
LSESNRHFGRQIAHLQSYAISSLEIVFSFVDFSIFQSSHEIDSESWKILVTNI